MSSLDTVVITGGTSMMGRFLIEEMKGLYHIIDPTREEVDLHNKYEVQTLFRLVKPKYVVHLAGHNGGIGYNKTNPAEIFEKTTRMALNVLGAAAEYNVPNVFSVLASCSYPHQFDIMEESHLHDGLPHDSVECHGYAKRILHIFSKQIHKQYGTNAVCCVVNNCFGPYDKFNINRSKMVAALIKKFVDAKLDDLPNVQCWGTGTPRRDFIYIKDVARIIKKLLPIYTDVTNPINIGSVVDYSIKEWADMICELTQYKGKVEWLTDKPDGQAKKLLDTTKLYSYLDKDELYTDVKEALMETINWYTENRNTWTK